MTQLTRFSLGLLAVAVLALGAAAQEKKEAAPAGAGGKVSFDKQIRPIFQGVCVGCHQPDTSFDDPPRIGRLRRTGLQRS